MIFRYTQTHTSSLRLLEKMLIFCPKHTIFVTDGGSHLAFRIQLARVLIFRPKHTFFVTDGGGPNWPLRCLDCGHSAETVIPYYSGCSKLSIYYFGTKSGYLSESVQRKTKKIYLIYQVSSNFAIFFFALQICKASLAGALLWPFFVKNRKLNLFLPKNTLSK